MHSWDELTYISFFWRNVLLVGWAIITWPSAFIGPAVWCWGIRYVCIWWYEKKSTGRAGLSLSQILGPVFLIHEPVLIGININCTPKISRHSTQTILWDDLVHRVCSVNYTVRFWTLYYLGQSRALPYLAIFYSSGLTTGAHRAFGLLLSRMGILRLLLPQKCL